MSHEALYLNRLVANGLLEIIGRWRPTSQFPWAKVVDIQNVRIATVGRAQGKKLQSDFLDLVTEAWELRRTPNKCQGSRDIVAVYGMRHDTDKMTYFSFTDTHK